MVVFRKYFVRQVRRIKAYIFIGYVAGNQQLYKYFKEAGFLLIFKPVLNTRTKNQKKW